MVYYNEDVNWCKYLGQTLPATLVTASPAYSDRDGAMLIIDDAGNLHLLGGWDGGGSRSDNHYKSTDGGATWVQQTNDPWGARHTFGVAKIGTYWFVYGSDAGGYPSGQKGIWRSTDLATWTEVNANPVFGYRWVYGACAHNGWMYLIGGYIGNGQFITPTPVDEVLRSKDGVTWETVCTNCLPESGKVMLSGHMVSFKGGLYMFCPSTYSDTVGNRLFSSKVYVSWNDGLNWTYISDIPGNPTHYGNAFTVGNYIFFKSGYNVSEGNTNRLYYSTDAITWTQLSSNGLSNGHADSMIATPSFLMQAAGNLFNDVKKITIAPSISVCPPPSVDPPLMGNLMMWFDGTDAASISIDGSNKVAQWNDKSGNNRHATQATAGNKPVKLTDSIQFDNVDDYLILPAITPPDDYTVIIAFEVPDKNDVGNLFGFQRSDGNARFSWGMVGLNIWVTGGKLDSTFGDGVASGAASAHTTARHIPNAAANNAHTIFLTSYANGSNAIVFNQDSTSAISNTAYLSGATSVTNTPEIGAIGRYGDFAGLYFGGKIFHILLYNASLTTQQKQDAIDFIKLKHGW